MKIKDKIQKYLGILLFGINVKERIYTGLRFNEANQNRVLASRISDFMKEDLRVFVSRNESLYIEWGDSSTRIIFEIIRISFISLFLTDKLKIDIHWSILLNLSWNVINLIIQYKNEETIRYLIRSLQRNIDDEIILIKVSLTSFLNNRFNCDDEKMFIDSITSTISFLIEIHSDSKEYVDKESWQEVLDILSDNSINYSNRIEKIVSLIKEENLLKTNYYSTRYNNIEYKYQKIIGEYSRRIL